MKKTNLLTLCITLLLTLTACGGGESAPVPGSSPDTPASGGGTMPSSTQPPESAAGAENDGGILIAYFSMPEGLDAAGVDAVSGASIVMKDGEKLGNVQYMAQIIQEAAGGNLFRIEALQEYPAQHDTLIDFADNEKDQDARPELKALPENLDAYGTVFLGYPNWWADLPMPVYTFLESVDLSGKAIIPFCPHGGSGFSRTVSTIADLQPGASVSEDGLSISRSEVAKAKEDITAWVQSLGY